MVDLTNKAVVAAGAERAQNASTLVGRLKAFIEAAVETDAADRTAARFLVTAVLESQRHPELKGDHDPLADSRQFVKWAVQEAIASGELALETDIDSVVEMLVAVLWGMGFYAGFVGGHDDLETITDQLGALLEQRLWQLQVNPAPAD